LWRIFSLKLWPRNEARELIELDRSLKGSFATEALTNASQRVGRNQLRRMRALKTERVVTRYWDAVHAKQATGWHTIVFGMVLAIYSIPLRQGLNHYAQQTICGFLEAGGAGLRLTQGQIDELQTDLLTGTPALIERALSKQGGTELRCV
jgi:urease accessory protein UreF